MDQSTKLQDLKTQAEGAGKETLIDQGCLPQLIQCMREPILVDAALDIILLLTIHEPNRKRLVQEPFLLEEVRKMFSRGSLKQKKLSGSILRSLETEIEALSATTNEKPKHATLTEITNTQNVAPSPSRMLLGKRVMGKRPGNIPTRPVLDKPAKTFTVYVEDMKTEESKEEVETCLLSTPGVISFFSDIMEEKIVIRSSSTYEEISNSIFSTCKKRVSTIRGDFSSFSHPDYHGDSIEANQNNGWLTSIIQIVAATPQKQAPQQQQQGWFGSWW
eukprot:TRINITY_DN10329_c0_g1_i1.p1 TRINITY_DN10329_c0_g1~~TRINITY_DN10329_c0_g1_i1.p1  ORF type:complete len:275 (-),score=76.87 TRINITY_DN10329_c0_g1_i1:191-1015(-)